MRRMRKRFWLAAALGLALGCGSVLGQTPEQVAAANALLQGVAVSDLAASASALVAGAPKSEETNVLAAVLTVVAERKPAVVPYAVAAVAIRTPTLAPTAAAVACRKLPRFAVAISREIARVPSIDREAVRSAIVAVVPDQASAITTELVTSELAKEPPRPTGK